MRQFYILNPQYPDSLIININLPMAEKEEVIWIDKNCQDAYNGKLGDHLNKKKIKHKIHTNVK